MFRLGSAAAWEQAALLFWGMGCNAIQPMISKARSCAWSGWIVIYTTCFQSNFDQQWMNIHATPVAGTRKNKTSSWYTLARLLLSLSRCGNFFLAKPQCSIDPIGHMSTLLPVQVAMPSKNGGWWAVRNSLNARHPGHGLADQFDRESWRIELIHRIDSVDVSGNSKPPWSAAFWWFFGDLLWHNAFDV